jgi:hypothetical protein
MEFKETPEKILTFDIENRPLSYWYDGNCTAEVTAIAWSWGDPSKITTYLLGEHRLEEILTEFRGAYDEADIVTGHYIRKHDLPIINGALLELELPHLSPKLSSDTKLDLTRTGSISASQESLAAYLGVEAPKIQMSQADWRAANRLTRVGLDLTRQRVEGDIIQHLGMQKVLKKRKLIGPPKEWRPDR